MAFNFLENYILENDRVKLSPLHSFHINELVSISEESDLWTHFIEKGNGRENLEAYINESINNRKLKKEYPFIVFDKKNEKYAGTTRFYEYSQELKNIKLGHTWYGKEFRGTGLNKHCKYLLFQFVFDILELERIGFGASSENEISIAALQSVGCKKEGILRSFLPSSISSKRVNIVLLSILKEEWIKKERDILKYKL
ncbi:RimJ/RimL family protein N-acetyltransferase [Maribacter vaceletii]|uniref:RimJ/RimL family protein N-acetyltransferase n=1 Tax=Maribacter vaceletii TaxID=1206816 RepID=A0A495EDA6_9FLAO|nr:GNAT family protein [Maribacter vaceletii]RKR14880.1 RimJ/RimL family protein N-acetyltransferase [Maribacter vaceletii]